MTPLPLPNASFAANETVEEAIEGDNTTILATTMRDNEEDDSDSENEDEGIINRTQVSREAPREASIEASRAHYLAKDESSSC